MATLNVSTVAGFTAAVNSAKAGDVIQLAAGTYSGIVVSNKNFASGITITSADLKNPATFVNLSLSNVTGVTFSHLEFSIVGSKDPYYGFRIDSSKNIAFSNVDVHGDPSISASAQQAAFYITYSSGISFDKSTFEHLGAGVVANNDTGVNISNSTFTEMNKGGLEMGGTSNVTIANNTFSDFQVSQGTHPDAIQIYTAGTTASAHDISITGNLIERGSGDAMQGIFVSDEVGNLPFINLSIQNNVILGGMWDSLYVSNVKGNLQINNNYVASWAGVDQEGNGIDTANATTGFAGYIWLQNVSGATLTETGNTAQAYLGNGGATLQAPTGNTQIGVINPVTTATTSLSPVTAVAQKFMGTGFGQITGNALTGDTGDSVYLASLSGGNGPAQLLSASGTTFSGLYGSLTISSNGSFTYNEKIVATVGVTYDDKFTMTVGSNGKATSTTLDFIMTFNGVGDGKADYITGGAAASTISGFGAGSQLTSGAGAATFVFNSIAQSGPTTQTVILGFKNGDVLDLTAIDPKFRVVAKLDGGADELHLAHLGTGNWQIEGDTKGTGTANFIVHLGNETADTLNLIGGKLIGASSAAAAATVVTTAAVAVTTATATAGADAAAAATAAANAAAAAAATAAATAAAAKAAAAAAAVTATPVVAVAKTSALLEHQTVTGNVLTGDTGIGLSLASVGVGTSAPTAVAAAGSTFNTADGALTVHQDGSYSYVEQKDGLTAGQVYDDHFTITVAGTNGKQATTTLDFLVTGSATGNGGVNYITGGTAATTISGFGAGSQLTSGVGKDTFVFNTLAQSANVLIKGFKLGDMIDLSAIDPKFHIVSQFDKHPDELVLQHLGNGNWWVMGDTVGSGTANLGIHLVNMTVSALTASSFHL